MSYWTSPAGGEDRLWVSPFDATRTGLSSMVANLFSPSSQAISKGRVSPASTRSLALHLQTPGLKDFPLG